MPAATARRIRWEVLPAGANGQKRQWKVTRDGELMKTCPTKREAVEFAATTARAAWRSVGQLATLKIKGRNGRIQDERTYGRDPANIKG